jgi:hypothetical protein
MDEKQKPLYELYTELPESGYQVADTYEEFEKAFTTDPDAENNRHALFEELKEQGLGPDDYETFYSTLFQPKDANTSVAIDPNAPKPGTQPQTKQADQTSNGTPTNVAPGTGSATGTTDKVAAAKDANNSLLDGRPSITSVLDNVANDVKQAVTTPTDPQLTQSAQSASMQHGQQSPTVVNQQEKSRGYNVWKTKINNAFDNYAQGKIDDKQFKSTIDSVAKDIESRTDNNEERNEFNTFIKDLQKRAQNTRSTKSVQVQAGYEAFPDNSDSVVWDFKLSRKQLPHQQDYVRTLRNMVTGGQSFNVMYNVTDPEIQRDYQIVSDPKAESTYKPNDYILGESKDKKDRDYQLYAAYLYLNGGDLPDWLDYTAQNKIKALSKEDLETKANQWKSLVDGTRTKRKYKGLNSIADYYASQNTYSTGEARATHGNRFATIVLPNGTYQTVDIHGVKGEQASVGDARKAFNARFNSTETADGSGNGNAQAPKGDTYLMPTIFNEERYSNSFPEWDDLDDKAKAQFDNSVFKYWDEMNKRQAISVPVFVENGKSVDKAEDEFNAKNAKTQFAQLTKREEIESQIKHAKKLREQLETAFENLRQSAKEERGGGVNTLLGDAGQFRVAFHNIDNFIEAGERAIKDRHYSALASFWENLTEAGGWSLGLTDLNEALGLNHLASGEGVNPEIEKAFGGKKGVQEFAAAVQYFGQKSKQWREKLGYYDEAGKAGLIQFMGSSLLPTFKVATIAGNAAKGVVKYLGKYAVKALDEGVAEVASASVRAVSKSAINRSLKTALKEGGMAAATRYGAAKTLNVGVNATALVAQGFTDGTILSVPEVFTNVANYRTGNAQVAEITREGIKFGDKLFVHDNQKSERDVIKETFQRGQAEWMGMRLGEIVGPWSRYLDQHMMSWGKTAYKKTLGKFLDGSYLDKTLGMIAKGAKATDVYKFVTNRLEQAGMGGSLTFYAQNNLSQLINAITVGDKSVSEALSGKKGNNISWADMTWGQIQKAWGAVIDNAIVCGIHTTIGAASYKKQCFDLARLQRKNEKECAKVLGEEYWANLKHDIDLCGETSDKALIAYTRAIKDNTDLSNEAKQAIINYALTLKTQQALNYGALNNGKTNALDLRYQDAYDAGADVKSPDEISKLQENVNSAKESLAKLLECSTDEVDSKVKGFGEDYREIYEEATKNIADEQKKKEVQNALDVYFTNLAAVEGAHDALIIDHEQELEQNKSYVEQNSNKESGTTIQATDKDGRIWYVISGDPRSTNSSDMLIVRDGVTGEIGHGSVSEFEFASEQNTQDLVNEGNKSISEEYLSKRNAILKGETLPERGDKVSVLDANGKVIEVTVEDIEQSETDGTPTGITVRTEDGQLYNFTTDEYRNAVKGVAERETATYIGNDNSALNRAVSSSQIATGTEFVHNGKRYTFDHIDDKGNWVARPVGQEGHLVEFSEEEVRTGIDDLLAGKVQDSEQSEANNDEEIKVGTEFTFEDGTPGVVTEIRDDGTIFIASEDSPISFETSRERVAELIAKSHNAEQATDASGESPKTQDSTETAADDQKKQTAADISVGDEIIINGHTYKVEGIDGNRCAIEKDGRRYIWRVSDIEKGIEDGRVKINAETESTDAAEKSSETDIAPGERAEGESATGLSEGNKIPEGGAVSSDQETDKVETPHTDVEESSSDVKPQPQEGQTIVTGEKPKEVPTTEESIDHHTPALNRIPKDEKGEPMFEKAPLDQSYDALLEQTGGNAETTSEVIKEMIEDKRKALADAESEKIPHADGAMAKIAARKAHDEKVKQARQELEYWENLARVPEERAKAEEEPQPIGKGFFGNIYDQFKGKVKAAFDFLLKHKEGDLLGVFHRNDLGDIDLVWGDENMGLNHIISKHVGEGKDFATVEDLISAIDKIISDGDIIRDNENRYVVSLNGYRVGIRKDFDGQKKNWVVTAVDYNRSKEEKGIDTNPTSASHGVNESESAAPNDAFDHKGTNEHATDQTSSTEKAETGNKNSVSDQVSEASKGVDTESTGSKKTNARKTGGEPHAYPEQPLTERTRQACESVAKSLGIDVEWVDHLSDNGEFDPNGKNGRPVIRIARDAENPLSTVFGHEGTHAVRSISEEAYKSLVDKARAVVGEEDWNKRLKDAKELYEDDHLTDDQIVEEVVADIVGEMITNRDMAEKLAYRLDHPTLSALRDVARKMWESVKRFVGGNKLTAYEQAVKDFANTIERAFADAQKVYADEVATPSIEGMATRFGETFTDYRPQSVPWGSGTLTDKANAPKRYSQRQIIKGAGLDVDIEKDGKVTFSLGGRKFDKAHHLTVDDVKNIDSPLNALVNTCVKNGSLKDPETVFEKYTDFLNRVLDKGDKGFEYLSDQWAWSGEALYKSVSNNSDAQYAKSVDITRVCKKNEAVINAICELQLQQRYGVTPGQVLDLYNASIEQDFQVPCPVCYVFSRYINNGQYASALIQGKELYGDKIKDTSKMTPAQRQKYVQGWLDELSAIKQWKTEHKNEIAEAKRNLSTIMQTVDALAEDITSGKLTGALRTNAEKKIRALNKLYQESLNLVNYASLDGWITNFAIFKKGGKGTAEETTETDTLEEDNSTTFDVNEWHPYEDTYREGGEIYPDEVALDLRRAAEASVEYPGIERFRHTRGAAAGKAIQLAADNALGETAELLGIANPEDRKNNYSALQKAYAEASPEARAKLMKMHEDRIKKAIVYAARQTLRGGIRQWSWSDNIERLSPDVFVNLMQIHMIGGALQAYSKQLEGVELVAAMNGYVNGSLMGKGIGYQRVSADYDGPKYYNARDGQYYSLVFDNVVGIEPFDHDGKHGLFYLNQMYDRAGNIIVGMDDIHVRACMADPRIFFIIPWHKSGMTNHILMQMYSYLGVPLDGLEGARDYTDVQEEKKYTEKSNVPSDVQSFWESHNYNDKFRSGIGTIESGRMVTGEDGKTYLRLSDAQLHYRELRNALLEHNSYDANDKFWAEHQDWLQEIEADEFLSQVRKKVKAVNDLGETMTSGDTSYVYPYEYWDMNSTFDTADVNGQRYLEYCRRMGFQPKFTGIAKGKFTDYGNFADEPGYWKLLIDRRMYDRQGKFQDLTPVTLDGFTPDLCDPEKTGERFNVTRVADDAKTKDIVERAKEMERERGYAKTGRTRDRQFVPTPKYDSSSTYASRAAKREVAAQRYNKAALADARVLADAKSILEGKAKDAYETAKAKGNVSEERLAQLEKEYKDAKKEREKAQKTAGTTGVRHSRRRNPTPEERAMRDELANTMKNAGIDVSVDDEVGQRVIDLENENQMSKAMRFAYDEMNKNTDESLTADNQKSSRPRGESSVDDAKVDNRIEISKNASENLRELSQNLTDGSGWDARDFLLSIQKALGSSNENPDKTQYFKNDDDYTLRLANHRSNARMFIFHDHTTGNTSIVVKMSDKQFKNHSEVELKEFVYFPDKMTTDVQQNIINGLQHWVETGEYNQPCDQIKTSEVRNGIREQIVKNGNLSHDGILQLAEKMRASDNEDTIRNSSTKELFSLLRELSELNANAYKGYGALSSEQSKINHEIYSVKDSLLCKIAQELVNRGEDVGNRSNVLYFREPGTGIQFSFHYPLFRSKLSELTSKLNFTNKNPEWDRVRDSWTMSAEEYAKAKESAQRIYSKKVDLMQKYADYEKNEYYIPFIQTVNKLLHDKRILNALQRRNSGRIINPDDIYAGMSENLKLATRSDNWVEYEDEFRTHHPSYSYIFPQASLSYSAKVYLNEKVAKELGNEWEIRSRVIAKRNETLEKVSNLEQEKENTIREQRVYHGSGADFDHFDHSFMGTGEGLQIHGYGTYVTVSKETGEGYARKLADEDGSGNLYSVEVPDNTGDNYLEESQEYTPQSPLRKSIDAALQNRGLEPLGSETLGGRLLYRALKKELGGGKAASDFLSELGLKGVHYTGRQDGECYVIFNEADAKITDHIRFFRTPNGEAYGFTKDGKIYIDPRIAKADTPIHEYTHLWATALRQGNPEEWANVVNLMKGEKELWDEVKKRYPELKTDDEIADEVLAHYSGKRGAERLREEQRKIAEGEGSTFEKARAIRALEKVKQALNKFWEGVADFLHIHYTSAEEVADRVMSDLLSGVNPTKYGTDNKVREQFLGEKGAENLDKYYVTKDRMDNKSVAEEMEKADKDAVAIKMATGWERGADGKWRYEVPDFTVDFEYAQQCIENGKDAPLWRVTRETDLFLAYPELGDIPVKFTPRSDEGGHYDPNNHEIVVSTYKKLDQESFHDVLIHEVQHAIQDIEGFNPGANPQDSRVKSLAGKADRYYMAQRKAQASAKGNLKRMSQSAIKAKEEEVQKEYDVDYLTAHLIVDTQRRTRFPEEAKQKIIKKLVQKCHNTPLEVRKASADYINDPYYFFKTPAEKSFDVYMKNMGEVEARNAETRRGLSDFTRRNTIATDTEDIPRDKQIIVYDDGNVSSRAKMHSQQRSVDENGGGGNGGGRRKGETRTDEQDDMTNVEMAENGNNAVLFREMPKEELSQRVEKYDAENDSELGRFVDYLERGRSLMNGENGRFKIGKTGDLLNKYGINGEISIGTRAVNPNWHTQNGDHNLTPSEWVESMESINNPLAITAYQNKPNSFRIYTNAIKNGKSICLGVDVKRNGNGVEIDGVSEITDIKTAFGRNVESAINKETILYPEGSDAAEQIRRNFAQSSEAHNSLLYGQSSVSAAKIENKSESSQETTEKESPEAKTAAVDTLSKEMNLQGNVTVLTSTEGLTGKKASAPGWCDPKTGHITIVLPNNADAADVQKTVFHEAVGHHGLRRLVGDGNFNDFLDNVYNNAEQGITQAIDQLAKEKHQGDRRKATEEYMSTLAEDGSFLNAGNRSLFQKVKQLFTDLLRKAGINLGTELTDNDLRYILWKSYKNLTDNGNPDVFTQAEDIAKQNHLKVGDYAKHETAAEREINNADNERGLLFRGPSAPNNDPMNVASSYYNQKAETLGTKTLFGGLWAAMRHPKENGRKFLNEASESFFDYSRSVKALQDGIAKALGRPIRDDEDAWRTMNTLPAVNQEQLNAVQNNLVAPLGEHIGNIIKNTKDKPGGARTMDDVEIYLNCKHGLERNKAMAERNAEEVMDKAKKNLANMMDKAYAEKLRIMASGDQQAISDYNKNVSHIKSRMGQGKRIADSEYAKVAADQLGTFADRKDLLIVIGQTADAYIDASRDQYVEAQRKDYSGLTEIFHPDYKEQRAQGVTYDVNDLEDEAQNLVAQFEGAVGKADIDELWKLVGNLTDFALRKSYVSGNISLQQYQDTKAMYANYVPLRGWNSKNADDVYNYVSGGNGLTPEDFQKVMKKAYGRESRAGYIFGTMIDMATTAVSQGNRNVMKQCLLNLAERSQTNLLRAGEVVYEQSSNGTLTPVLPKVHDGMTEQEIADAYSDWQDDVKNGLANGTYIRINSKLKTGFNAPQWEEDQHQIVVNRNGKKYIVYVNGNPRAAQAVNGLLDFTSDYNATEKQLLRHFAAVQTSFSPEFVVSNAQRDLATAAASGFIKEGAGYTKDFVANYFKIMPGGSLLNGDAKTGTERVVGIYDLIRRYDSNELDLTNDTDRYYYEFCTNGGKTGITNLRRIEDYQEQVDKMTREVQNKYGTMPRKAVKGILDAIEYINAGVENATRFATYMTSRQRGKSVKQSIHDAKECSVNFNAHGSGAWMDSFFRKHYNYANAVFQSLRMNKEWMKSNPQRYTGVVAGALAMGMLSALLGTAICGGNDDDENGYYGLSEWNRYRFFNIPVAKHGFLHYALPQEFRGMFGTGASIVDLINGKITTDHFVKTLMSNINDFSVVPFYDDDAYNLSSGDMSIPGMLVKGFIPTIVAPITDAYLYNRDFLGRPITNATSNNQQAPEWQRAGKNTPQVMIDASKWLNEHTGGQPNRRGGLENATGTMLNPSAIWYIIEQVGGGTMTFATKMKKTFEAMLTGNTSELKENDIPFAGKFYVSSSDDKSKQRTINEQYNGITQDFKNLDYELRKNWRGKNITDGEFNVRMRELMDEGQVELWDSIVGNEHTIKTMQRAIHKNPDNEELKKELDSLIYQNKVEIVHKYEAWKKKYHK